MTRIRDSNVGPLTTSTRTVTVPLDVYAVVVMCLEYHDIRGQIIVNLDGRKIASIQVIEAPKQTDEILKR